MQEEMDKAAEKGDEISEADLDNYDALKNLVVKTNTQLKDTTGVVKFLQKENQELRQQTQQQALETKSQQGMRLLDAECDKLDKQFGAHLRNEVLDQVNKEYEEAGMASLSDKSRVAWIKNTLKLRYSEAAEKNPKPKSSSTDKDDDLTTDTGTGGGSPPGSDIPAGSFEDVTKAIDERNAKVAAGQLK